MLSETSKESYRKLEDTGDMGRCNHIVYTYIKYHSGCTLKEMCEGTGLLQETVCGRKKYLEEQGLIIKDGEKLNTDTNRRVEKWKLNDGETKAPETPQILCLTDKEMTKVKELVDKANEFQKTKIKGWCEDG